MNAAPLLVSLELAAWTAVLMLPLGLVAGRALAWRRFRAKPLVEAAVALPLVLPPTVRLGTTCWSRSTPTRRLAVCSNG